MGTLLFLVYVNDLMDTGCEWKAFADDFKLCAYKDGTDGLNSVIGSLQADLDSIASRSYSWNLKLNHSKCKVMRFGKGKCNGSGIYHLNGCQLEAVGSYRDLGVVVDASLKFHMQVREVVRKAGGLVSNLLRTTVCRSGSFMTSLFVSHIRPILDYCSCVWGTGYLGDLRMLESVQRRWTREVEGLGRLEYRERLKRMDLYSVMGRMLRMDLIKVWKAFNSSVDVGLSQLLPLSELVVTRGHQFKLRVQTCRTENRRRFFSVRVVRQWNALPSSVVDSVSLAAFKGQLDGYLGDRLFEAPP